MKTKIMTALLIFSPIFQVILQAQSQSAKESVNPVKYIFVERRDQDGQVLEMNLLPTTNPEEKEKGKQRSVNPKYELISLNYDLQFARVKVNGEQRDVPLRLKISTRIKPEKKPPAQRVPGIDPNKFVSKYSKEELDDRRSTRFQEMEAKRRERKPVESPAKDPSRPANP